jgi:HK97 family phage major capsid protein
MALSNAQLLEKATLTSTADFGGAGQAPLSIEQVDEFIELLSNENVMLPDVHTVKSTSAKWQEPIIDFASRVARPGVQGARLADGDRVKPNTGNVEISTVLLRAEVPIADEVFEDNTAKEGFAGSVERTLASRFGFDVEDLMLNGDTASADAYLALLNGWIKQAQGAGGHVVNASSIGQDYQVIFKKLLQSLPDRHKRGIEADGRFYVPKRLEEAYRDILSSRGTPLGDLTLQGNGDLKYQAISIKGVPSMAITAGTPDTSFILLTNRKNLYAGYRRSMTMETWRDPREGATSFIVTARVDAEVAVPDATAIATNVDVEP